MEKIIKQTKIKGFFSSSKWCYTVFLFVMLLYPMTQFIIFYLGVNINSILLAFQKYDSATSSYGPAGFANFADLIRDIFTEGALVTEIGNSAICFSVRMAMLPAHIFVAYFLWKKLPFSTLYTILLFLPTVISSTVFALIYKTICANVLPSFGIPDLITAIDKTGFWTVLVYDEWLGFANGMVLYLGAMGAISTDVVEYGKLEKMGMFREFIHIVIPGIFPTIIAYVIADMAGFFTNYGSYFTFFGARPASNAGNTLGFHFFVMLMGDQNTISLGALPYAATGGLFFTFIITPLTILVKWLMEKFGPSED